MIKMLSPHINSLSINIIYGDTKKKKTENLKNIMEDEFKFLYRHIDTLDNREAKNIEKVLESEEKYFSLGTNTLKIEKKLRRDKKEIDYNEPWEKDKTITRKHRWNSEEARKAANRRWENYRNRKKLSQSL